MRLRSLALAALAALALSLGWPTAALAAAPSATVVIADPSLTIGETTSVSFTFTEPVTDFTLSAVTVSGGTLSDLTQVAPGIAWTAVLTPVGGMTSASNYISVDLSMVTGVSGTVGVGTADSDPFAVDTQAPTATVRVSPEVLVAGSVADVLIEFSEPVTGFTASAVIPGAAAAAGFTMIDSQTWKFQLTPMALTYGPEHYVTLKLAGVRDLAGNSAPAEVRSNRYSVATTLGASIALNRNVMGIGQDIVATVSFLEPVTNFTAAAISAPYADVRVSGTGTNYTVTLTPHSNVAVTDNVMRVNLAGLTSQSGAASNSAVLSAPYSVDTLRPMAIIMLSASTLRAGSTATATIMFTEPVTGLSLDDLSATNSTVSNLTPVTRAGSAHSTYTATITPEPGIVAHDNVLTVDTARVRDLAGNSMQPAFASSIPFVINTATPGASVTVHTTALGAGDTSRVTIAFTEPVTGFDLADLSTNGGTLDAVTSSDGGKTWVTTLTSTRSTTETTAVITLDLSGVTSAVGNAGVGTVQSAPYTVAAIAGATPEPTPEPTATEQPAVVPSAPETTAPAPTPTSPATPVTTAAPAEAAPLAATGTAPAGLIAVAGLLLALGAALRLRKRRIG